jgi:hypothetical protein
MGPAPTIAIRLSATSVTFHLMSAGMPMSLTCSVKVTPTAAPVGAAPRQPLCMVSQSGMRLRSARTPSVAVTPIGTAAVAPATRS